MERGHYERHGIGFGEWNMAELESEHVHKVYSQIAAHFSDTRFKPWPRIAQFLSEQPAGSLVADVGCGNGKYLGVNSSVCCIGSDICSELVSIAGRRGHEVVVMDCLNLPYRSGVFDAAICVAVVHHLSTVERREKSVRELARVVRPGGRLLVYVWAMEQSRKKFDAQDVMVPWHLQRKYSDHPSKESGAVKPKKKKTTRKQRNKNRNSEYENIAVVETQEDSLSSNAAISREDVESYTTLLGGLSALELGSGDFESVGEGRGPSKKEEGSSAKRREKTSYDREREMDSCSRERNSPEPLPTSHKSLVEQGYQTFQRYYHVFQSGELTALFGSVPGTRVLEEFYDHENWCVLVSKEA